MKNKLLNIFLYYSIVCLLVTTTGVFQLLNEKSGTIVLVEEENEVDHTADFLNDLIIESTSTHFDFIKIERILKLNTILKKQLLFVSPYLKIYSPPPEF